MHSREIPILYEDNHLLVVEKPVNVPSQGDSSGDPDMLGILKQDIKERYQKPGNVYLGLVHRLDRPVGGVMVFAKTSKAASRLSEQIRTRTFDKTYFAVVHGSPNPASGRMEDFLEKDRAANQVKVVSSSNPQGKRAVLEYKVLAQSGEWSLCSIHLLTGRPHQIRVQFSSAGHPLYGDQKYGTELSTPGQQIALWSVQLTCIHPTQKEEMTFRSAPPKEFPWSLFSVESFL